MKAFLKEFFKRGFISAWGGPFVLAIIYFIVGKLENVQSIPIDEFFQLLLWRSLPAESPQFIRMIFFPLLLQF